MMYDELIKRLRRYASYDPRFVIQDCEDAADAIEELSKQRDLALTRLCEWCGVCSKEHRDAWGCDDIARLQELQLPRWIPVTERLPEDKERVLIFYLLSTKPKIPWYKVATFSTKLSDVDEYDFYGKDYPGFYGSDPEYGYYEHTDVTHWMPLPQPPKEG